jgi:Flp pilus assembly protein CpaB
MEMEFKDPGARRRRLLLVVGVVTAVVAGLVAFQMSQGNATAVEPQTQQVLVATHDIAARTIIQSADVTLRSVPQDPSLAIALTDPTAVVGRVTTVPLVNGQVIYPTVFVGSSSGSSYSILDPNELVTADSPYWRAVSVSVPKERAVAGTVMAGEHVDLFATVSIQIRVLDASGAYVDMPTSQGYESGDSTKITFQDVEVLDALPDEGLYVIKVDEHQAEQISHIAKVAPGSFSMALRPDADTRAVDPTQYGETNDSIIMQYLFRVPQLLDLTTLTANPAPIVPVTPPPAVTPTPPPASTPAPTATP